jgi:hypothetical protein
MSQAATIFNVSWMAIVLGLAMQGLILGLQAAAGKVPGASHAAADLVQKVSWSFLVCAGLASGSAASRLRGAAMGLAGLLSAPLAFAAARSLHKSAQQALSIIGTGSAASPVVLALVKAVEYGCLGVLLARLARRPGAGARAHGLAGLAVGVVFGGWILWILVHAASGAGKPLPALAVASAAVNEILFPVGCSLVIHSAHSLGRRAASREGERESRASQPGKEVP